jgi:hypothetical protein
VHAEPGALSETLESDRAVLKRRFRSRVPDRTCTVTAETHPGGKLKTLTSNASQYRSSLIAQAKLANINGRTAQTAAETRRHSHDDGRTKWLTN